MTLMQIHSSEVLDSILQKNQNVLVMLSSPQCGPCRSIRPFIEECAAKYHNITFIYIDLADFVDTGATLQGVTGLPTFRIYRNGELAESFAGANRTKVGEILERLIGSDPIG